MQGQKVNFHIAQLNRNNTITTLRLHRNIPLSKAYTIADKRINNKGMILSSAVIIESKPLLKNRKDKGNVIADIQRKMFAKLFNS